MSKIRVLVTDDSVVVRRIITDMLSTDPLIEVVGTASNGKVALTKIASLKPDLVTLDIEMPEMDGLETLRELRKIAPGLPVIMFSSFTERGASATFEALSLGASDYVTKPANVGSVTQDLQAVRNELIPKVRALCGRPQPARRSTPVARVTLAARPTSAANRSDRVAAQVDIVVIGVSTGGPNALATVWSRLSPNLRVPVVVVQHMPPVFTAMLAERLTRIGTVPIREGVAGGVLTPGEGWLAPGDHHLVLQRSASGRGRICLNQDPHHLSCRPAVDPMFLSAVRVYGAGVLAVVLTGMGNDGQEGARAVRDAGGQVLAQDRTTSVVWGMPGAVVGAGLADVVLPLDAVANEINLRAGVKPSRGLSTRPTALSAR